MMDPIVEPFIEFISKVKLKRPRIPYVSNVTGTWITAREATSPRYWANHLRHTVRFSEGLQTLFKEPDLILLEVGPGQSLSTFARRHPGKPQDLIVLSSLRQAREPQPDLEFLFNKLGRLWMRALKRRSQSHHLSWERMRRYIDRWLPPARICHPYPLVRFGAITQGKSRMR